MLESLLLQVFGIYVRMTIPVTDWGRFYPNSIPRARGRLHRADSAAHAMYFI
jgi:hypothetical protein